MLDRKAFFAHVRAAPFDDHLSDKQVAGMSAILDAFDKHATADLRFRAYMLGTTFWESARTMQPVREKGEGRGHSYGVPAGPYRQIYYGRGLCQITWYEVYAHIQVALRAAGTLSTDIDIVRHPDLVLRPDAAASILIGGMERGLFTGRKLADYFTARGADWTGARRIINGTDHAADVAAAAQHFWAALKAATPAHAAV